MGGPIIEVWPHRPWAILPLWGFGQSLGLFCGKGGVLFSVSGVPPKEELQSRAPDTGDRKTPSLDRIAASGHGKPDMRALGPLPRGLI